MSKYALAGACFFHLAVISIASGQTPLGTSFTYQGRLEESGSPANGTYDFRFRLFDAPSGGNQVGPDVSRENVVVSTGLFTVGIDFGAVFGNQRRFLEVGVRPGASTGAYDVVSGRHELSAAPSALYGASAPWAGVTGKPAGFADDVDNDMLAGMACSNGQVAKSNGTGWACGTDLNATYTPGPGIQISGTVVSIPPSGIATGMIADLAVTQAKIALTAVGTFQLQNDAVTSLKLADDAVNSSHILDGTVTSADIGTSAVQSAEILDFSVGSADLGVNSVTSSKIAANAVQSSHIGLAQVQGQHIGLDSVGSTHIGDDSIRAADLHGTELPIYQMAGGCNLGGVLTTVISCVTIPCGGGQFETCSGTCGVSSPQICNNTLVGYLLATSIP